MIPQPDRAPITTVRAAANGNHTTRIGIQSADRLRRETLAAYLDSLPPFTVVGRVARYDDVVSLCALERPAIVLLDADRDIAEAVDACRLLRQRCPDVGLAVTYERLSAPDAARLRETGVDAVVPHAHGLDAVVAALHRLAAGRSGSAPARGSGLSRRQREILWLLASGHSSAEIGDLLRISPGTVENHKRRVYAKLGAASAVEAVARAASFGLIDGSGSTPGRLSPGTAALPVPAPGADRPSIVEAGRAVLTVAAGAHGEALDRVVETLIAHRIPVLRDHAPSWTDLADAMRWHRGPVVRVLVDPAPDHWRVGAAPWRGTVVVHSGRYDGGTAINTIANGGAALLPADRIEDQLVPVLTLVRQGYAVLDRAFARHFASTAYVQFAEPGLHKPTLTAREYDILRSIGRSHTVRQTARTLGIAVKTVENTQGHLFRKLGVRNRAEALAAAYSLSLLQPRSTQ